MSEEAIKVKLQGEDAGLGAALGKASVQLDGFGKVSLVMTKSLGQLEAQLKSFKEGLRTTTNVESFNRINRAIDVTKGKIDALKKAPVLPADLPKQTAAASYAITNFGRVVSDLPFGPGGIANNLEAVALSMKALKEQSAATGQSIGSILLQSLKGPGGLIAGVSLLSAGLSIATFGLSAWTRLFPSATNAADAHKKKLQEVKDQLQQYIDSLDAVNKSNLLGAQNAQEQIVSLDTLYKATQNANIPLSERRKLVDELQSQYPKYFKNISDETILAGGAEEAYKKLSTAILQSAKARAAQDQLVDIQKQILTNEKQTADALREETAAYIALEKARKAVKSADVSAAGSAGIGASATAGLIDQLARAEDRYAKASAKTNEVYKSRNPLLEDAKRLTDSIKKNIEQNGADVLIKPDVKVDEASLGQFNFFDKYFDVKPEKKKAERQIKEMVDTAIAFANKNFAEFEGLENILRAPSDSQIIAEGKKFWDAYQKGLIKTKPERIKLEAIELDVDLNSDDLFQKLPDISDLKKLKFDKVKLEPINVEQRINVAPRVETGSIDEDLERQIKDIQSAFSAFDKTTFSSIGEALAGALTGNSDAVQKAGEQIVNSMSSLADAIGDALINYGIVKTGLDKVLAAGIAMPGVTAIALGVAAKALASLIKTSFKPAKLATGGIIPDGFPNDTFPAMLSSREAVIPLDRINEIVGGLAIPGNSGPSRLKIRGRELVLLNAREQRSQRRGR